MVRTVWDGGGVYHVWFIKYQPYAFSRNTCITKETTKPQNIFNSLLVPEKSLPDHGIGCLFTLPFCITIISILVKDSQVDSSTTYNKSK